MRLPTNPHKFNLKNENEFIQKITLIKFFYAEAVTTITALNGFTRE